HRCEVERLRAEDTVSSFVRLVEKQESILDDDNPAQGILEALRALVGTVSEIDRGLKLLGENMAEQSGVLHTHRWLPEVGERVRSALRLLRPFGVEDQRKVRLGRDNDGGYVIIDDLSGVVAALSLGICDDASWDMDIAKRGIDVFQFDHTID